MGKLRVSLARKFIEKTADNLEFNINIMNDKGIIIASKDSSRVGDFHQVAYNMLEGKRNSGVVKKDEEKKYINTKAGVNRFIEYKHEHVGVICVSGNPDEVETYANLVKSAIEVMLEYDLQEEDKRQKKNELERFIYYLIYENKIQGRVLKTIAQTLNIPEDVHRIVIIIRNRTELENDQFLNYLRKAESYSKLDLLSISSDDDIVLLKYINGEFSDELIDFKRIINEYFDQVYHLLPVDVKRDRITVFVGTLQHDLEKYRSSYNSAYSLRKRIELKNGIHYFTDHILDYFRSQVSKEEYFNIFSIYLEYFDESDRKMFAETIKVLNRNNYNVVNSSKELYIHRNTLVFRLNKFKNILNLDPIQNYHDREFLNELAHFFEIYNV